MPDSRATTPSGAQRRAIWLLGLPTFALALSITVVTTYVPLIAQRFTDSAIVVGVLTGSEGLLALVLPLAVGTWSDQLRTPLGGRLPFLIAGTPPLALALALLGFADSVAIALVLCWVFFASYYVAYEPYRALYPDLVPEDRAGRSQSVQSIWRGAATGLALVAGGLLFDAVEWLPFTLAALVAVVVVSVFLRLILRDTARGRTSASPARRRSVREAAGELRGMLARRATLRAYLVCNALWEASLGALKTFALLYVTVGLGVQLNHAALGVGAVAAVVVGGALASGLLADRYGHLRVLRVTLVVYGLGLLVPGLTSDTLPVVIVAPVAALAGGALMTLPYALLMPQMPAGEHGTMTGFYSLSRGIGTMLGPLAAGALVQILRGPFAETDGYQAIWLVCSGTVLLSLVSVHFLARAMAEEGDAAGAGGRHG